MSNGIRAKFCSECAAPLTATPPGSGRETRKLVTILFADVAGSTALGERLDPETLRALLGRYFAVMRRIIEAHGGTVEKFIGDAVMAVFGIPVVHEDDALRAVRAADEIRTELAALDAELGASRGVAIRFRTGVNTGEVVAGDSATGGTMVTGDAVNTAARLEQAAPAGQILLGRLTWQLVRDAVTVDTVVPLSAKGKADPLPAYRLISVDPQMAGHVRRLDTPLVGRERELAALDNAFERVASERSCQLFTLLGTAGVGKSRLVAEFTEGIASQATVLRGRCLSYGEGITYWAIGEILRSAARIEETDSGEIARARLRILVDGERDADIVAARTASAIGLSTDAAPQEEVFWAIRKLFEHLARAGPLVVVIEDIHWAEPTLLDLIEHIADWSRDAPILLLCPARPELLDTRRGWSGGKLNASNVLLEPLGAEATGRLIAVLPGGSAIPSVMEARVTAAAEGNPLFVEEFVGMLVDDGALVQDADGTWTAATTLAEVRVPASINALLSARLERLAPDERAVAERASVVGRVFEQAAVVELASDSLRPEVGRSLLALVRKELVRPERSELSASDAFKFRHILIRDAAYEALPKAERAVLHERFADWLERTVDERLAESEEIVGYHLEQAYRYRTQLGESGDHVATLAGRAGERFRSAGGRAFDRGDMAAAESLLSRATRAYPIASAERLQLMPDIGHAMFSTGRITEAIDLLEAAAIEGRAAAKPVLAVRIELEAALVRILSGGGSHGHREAANASLPLLEGEGDRIGLARAHLVLASAAWMTGQIATAVQERQLALDFATQVGDPRTERRSSFWGSEIYGPAPAEAALMDLEATLDAAADDPLRRARTLFSLAGIYAMRDRAADARAACLSVRAILDELGLRVWSGASSEMGAHVELILGDPAHAERWATDGIARLEGLGATGYQANLRGLQGIALAAMGDVDAALEAADRSIRDSSSEDVLNLVIARTGRALALRGRGQLTAALESVQDAVQGAEPTDWILYRSMALLALADILEATGDIDGARRAAGRSLELSHAKGNLAGERRAASLLERLSMSSA